MTRYYVARNLLRCHWVHFVLALYWWPCGLPLRVVSFPGVTPFVKNYIFICKLLSIRGSLWIKDRGGWALLLLALGPIWDRPEQSLWMLLQCMWVNECCWYWFRWHCVLVFSIPSCSYDLSAFSSLGFLDSHGNEFDGDFPSWAVSKSLSLCLMSDYWSLCVFPSAAGETSPMMLCYATLFYLIFSFLFSTVVFGFIISPWDI